MARLVRGSAVTLRWRCWVWVVFFCVVVTVGGAVAQETVPDVAHVSYLSLSEAGTAIQHTNNGAGTFSLPAGLLTPEEHASLLASEELSILPVYDIAVDGAGHWHVVYLSVETSDVGGVLPELRLTYGSSAFAERISIISSEELGVFFAPAIEVDLEGVVHITFLELLFDEGTGDAPKRMKGVFDQEIQTVIQYTNNASGSFSSPEVVVDNVLPPLFPNYDLAVDTGGNWHIAYIVADASEGDIPLPTISIDYMKGGDTESQRAFEGGLNLLGGLALTVPTNPRIAVNNANTTHIAFTTVKVGLAALAQEEFIVEREVRLVRDRSGPFSDARVIYTLPNAVISGVGEGEGVDEIGALAVLLSIFFSSIDIALDSDKNWHMVVVGFGDASNPTEFPSELLYFNETAPEARSIVALLEGKRLFEPKIDIGPVPATPFTLEIPGCNNGNKAGLGDPRSEGILFLLTLSLVGALHRGARRGRG